MSNISTQEITPFCRKTFFLKKMDQKDAGIELFYFTDNRTHCACGRIQKSDFEGMHFHDPFCESPGYFLCPTAIMNYKNHTNADTGTQYR